MKIYIADVFTEIPGKGNPAGILFTPPEPVNALEYQHLAGELGVSENVLIFPRAGQRGVDYEFRFFAPREEVALCGHGTIGGIAFLYEQGYCTDLHTILRIQTKAGLLHGGKLDGGLYYMQQQLPEFCHTPIDRARVGEILGISLDDFLVLPEVGPAFPPLQIVSTGRKKLMVPLKNLPLLHGLTPDFAALEAYCREIGCSGFHVFTLETVSGKAGTHARHFAPTAGVLEDPVTGVAAGALGAYLVKYGIFSTGRVTRIYMEQGHILRRDGVLFAEIFRDGEGQFLEVKVCGRAVLTADNCR